MPTYKVSLTVFTEWEIEVEADSEAEALDQAKSADSPPTYAHPSDGEWTHNILEWPNAPDSSFEVEEIED